jgi:hypothetical protein
VHGTAAQRISSVSCTAGLVAEGGLADFRFLVGPPRGWESCHTVARGINGYCTDAFVSSVACRSDGGDPAQYDLVFVDGATCAADAENLSLLARAVYVLPKK